MNSNMIYGISGQEQNLADGLVGHWSFDEGSGSIVNDLSPYNIPGIIYGNPQWRDGVVGSGSLEFDGVDDYIQFDDNGSTPSQLRTLGVGSISIWMKARNIPVGSNILPVFYYGNANGCSDMIDASNEGMIIEIAHGAVLSRAQGVFFTIFANGCAYPSFCFDSHSNNHINDTQGIIEENRWYHFVAVVGENYNTGYLNGEEITYRHYNFNNSSASQFFEDALKHERMWIGKGYWDHAGDTYYDGLIDDVRIYDRPLNAEEVRAFYNLRIR